MQCSTFIFVFQFTDKQAANKKVMKVKFSDDITDINRITFINENGKTLSDNVRYSWNKLKKEDLTNDAEIIETNTDKEINIEAETIPNGSFFVKVDGTDTNGKESMSSNASFNDGYKQFREGKEKTISVL